MNEQTSLADNQLNDPHYLHRVTELGDKRHVVANREIYSSSGMKLISAGMRINSALYDRLFQHKLVPALDDSLSTEDAVTGENLAAIATQMFNEDKRLALIQSTQSDGLTILQVLKKVPLNPAISFKLTVMREEDAELFQNSIYVALVSTYIGMQLQMNKNQLVDLATAALLHDVGMLHVDPKLLARDHKMTEIEKRHLYVHSVTGAMILSAYPEYKRKVVDAVAQHHERLDGSGYPRGLRTKDIGQFGQIVAVAVIVASLNGSSKVEYSGPKLETMLKLNLRRYGGELVRYLKVFYQEEGEAPPCSDIDKQAAQEKLIQISSIFTAWENAKDGFDCNDAVSEFTNERMLNLKMEIIDAGLNPNVDGVSLLDMQDDSRACFDARTLLDETLWQLRDILREIKRRSPSIETEHSTSGSGALSAWIKELDALL